MDKKTLFKQAHAKARATVAVVGDYSIAFKLALKELYSENKSIKRAVVEYAIMLFTVLSMIISLPFVALAIGEFNRPLMCRIIRRITAPSFRLCDKIGI